MPNKKSAIKDLKQNAKRKLANDSILHQLKDILRKVRKSIESGASKTELDKLYKEAQKVLDKASKNNIIKKNAASRKKSSLASSIASSQKKSK
ncbi:30S ribosomal protein S20 [Patescibacteria group bacterium]|nr:30S ribosomal protein S20 [Patescibacteria group bacterium]